MRLPLGILFTCLAAPILAQVSVTIDTLPSIAGARFKVTGVNCQPGEYPASAVLTWTPGPACLVEFLLPVVVSAGTRYTFISWDDKSSTPAISIPVPFANAKRYVSLGREYLVTAESVPPAGATVTGGGWVAAGAKATIRASAKPGFAFLNWQSYCCGSISYPDPLTIEFPVDGPGTVIAATRITTAPLPRSYTVTSLPGGYGLPGGALTPWGAVAGYGGSVGGSHPLFLWQPERPNSALGNMLEPPGLADGMTVPAVLINDAGRLLYITAPPQRFAVWTPSAPGSATGTESLVQEPSNLNRGQPIAFNRFGQIAGDFSGYSGLWSPNADGATSGTTKLDAQFGRIQAMNDFGQVLSEPISGSGGASPTGFGLFTPSTPNTASGTFTLVSPPPGTTSTTARTINSRGDVAGTYCTANTGGACPSRVFLWKPISPNAVTGAMTDISPNTGAIVTSVSAMNSAGDLGGTMEIDSTAATPFLRTGCVYYDLMQIPGVPAQSRPIAINDAGQILLGIHNTLDIHLLTPQPDAPPPASNSVAVTIAADSAGGGFAVSGAGCQPGDYIAPRTLQWTPGAACQVRWAATQFTGPMQRREFAGWSDGQAANPRTFAAPASALTLGAVFRDEVFISAVSSPAQGGTANGSGWYQYGSPVSLTAAANPGFRFGSWGDPYPVSTGQFGAFFPARYTAFFVYTTPLPHTYAVTLLTGMAPNSPRLNNRGQVVSANRDSPHIVTLWTPDQANGTSGSVTTLTGFVPQYNSTILAIAFNDRGQIALQNSQPPLQLWSPSAPNGTQGVYSVVNLPSSVRVINLGVMNGYGQIFGRFSTGDGFWTPSPANGSSGALTILPGGGQILDANDRGQILLPSGLGSLRLFMPAAPNSETGSYAELNVPSFALSYNAAYRINARGAVALTISTKVTSTLFAQRPVLWTPTSDNASTGSFTSLPIPEGFTHVLPGALNSRSEISGAVLGVNRSYASAFVFTQDRFFVIEGIAGVPASSDVVGFNDSGQLLLYDSYSRGLYLLTPQSAGPACPVTTSRAQETAGQSGGRVAISVQAASNCVWSAAVADPWLSISGSATGAGNGTLLVDVSGNTTGTERTSLVTINGTNFTIRQALLPTVSLYPSSLRIVVGAKGATGPQEVQIRVSGAGAVTAAMYNIYPPELTATLAQTSLPGSVTVTYNKGSAVAVSGVYSVTVGLTGADQPSITLPVTLEVQPTGVSSKPPFGSFDTPANNAASLSGGVAVTGWALDDIGVEKVEIWRDRVGGEPVFPNGKVYIGDALFVADARPDVEAQFRTLPQSRRAGWGYMLLTNVLPNPNGPPGNGTYTFEAIATDREGNIASLGRKTFSVNNAASRKPFGALDTPAPGATISGGAYLSSGWALTPKPSAIPPDGRTIRLFIDGAPQGGVNYSQPRGDVAFFFPNHNNSTGPGGSKLIDTTKLSNGMHTIAWVVVDDQGNEDGMGSRYFITMNAGATGATSPTSPLTEAVAARDGDRLEAGTLGRVEFQLPASGADTEWEGALVLGEDKRPLPVGSTLNGRHGRFYWQPPPGFQGEYVLEFTNLATGDTHRVTVCIGLAESDRERR